MLKRHGIISVLILTLLSVSMVNAAKKEKTFQKEVAFAPGGKVSVKTVNGSIQVKSWDKNSVLVHADISVKTKSMRNTDAMMERIKIIVDKTGDNLVVRADYPKRHNGVLDWIFGTRVSVSISFDITVPEKCNLSVKSVNGGLDANGIDGLINMESTNGSVRGENLHGSLMAHTVNGGIRVAISPNIDNGDVQLESVNGGVKLLLPSDVKAVVNASTVNGGISSDFDITISGKYTSKKAHGTINGGGSDISISTVNGGISIRKE